MMMMFRALLLAAGLSALGSAPGVANDFAHGAIYGNEPGCIQANGGDGSDSWATLSATGIERHESSCDFISLNVGRYGDYLASAICYSEGYVYPELLTLSPMWGDQGISVVSTGDGFGEPEIFSRCKIE